MVITSQLVFYIQLGFLFHLIGDYILQNGWMANEKTKHWFPALVHATVYSLPFVFITGLYGWLIIFITHYFIDRYRLAVYIVRIRENEWDSDNFGFNPNMPKFLSTWLLFITDNTMHLIINTFSICFSYK